MPSQDILDNRQNVIDAHNPKQGFASGFTGGHDLETFDGINSWLTGGISGLFFSKLSSEEDQRKWEIEKKALEFGVGTMDSILDAYRKQGELENFTDEEAQEIKELMARKETILRDLDYVSRNKDGDLDAPIDVEGQSMNQRWGVSEEDEMTSLDLLQAIVSNPVHTSGMLAGMLVKDLPLGVATSLGLTAKGLKGGEIMTKLARGVNGIQPKALKGLVKAGGTVAGSAAFGAAYEAGYSKLNEGEVKWGDVQRGTEFGAAFGLLIAGAKGAVHLATPKPKTKLEQAKARVEEQARLAEKRRQEQAVLPSSEQSEPLPHGATIVKEPFRKGSWKLEVEQLDLNAYLGSVLNKADSDQVTKMSKSFIKDQIKAIFPALNKGYSIVSKYAATKAPKGGKPLITKKELGNNSVVIKEGLLDGLPHFYIIENSTALKAEHTNLASGLDSTQLGSKINLKSATPNMLKNLLNRDAYRVFKLTEAKADVIARMEGKTKANPEVIISELDRIFKEYRTRNANPSEAHVTASVRQSTKGKPTKDKPTKDKPTKDEPVKDEPTGEPPIARFPKHLREDITGLSKPKVPSERAKPNVAITALDKHKLPLAGAGAAIAYAVSEEEDAANKALATALGISLAPFAYRKLTQSLTTIPNDIARAKVLAAKGDEGWRNYVHQIEAKSTLISRRIERIFKGEEHSVFLDAIEGGKIGRRWLKDTATPEQKALVKGWHDFFKFVYGELEKTTHHYKKSGPELGEAISSGYVPHIIRGREVGGRVRPLTPEERAYIVDEMAGVISGSITGSVNSKFMIPRKIQKTVDQLKRDGYVVLDNPAEIMTLYTRSVTRVIHNRRLIEEFQRIPVVLEGSSNIRVSAVMTKKYYSTIEKNLTSKERELFKTIDHPSLNGLVFHTNYRSIVKSYINKSDFGDAKGFMLGVLAVNNGLKKLYTILSYFHANALLGSGFMSLGPTHVYKMIRSKGKMTDKHQWEETKLLQDGFDILAQEVIESGTNIIRAEHNDMVAPGLKEVTALTKHLRGAGLLVDKAIKSIDHTTWSRTHDVFKMGSFFIQKEKLLKRGMSSDAAATAASAEFTNAGFGSLNWDKFHTSFLEYAMKNPDSLRGHIAEGIASQLHPDQRKWLNLYLFAPDWTVSNLQILGYAFLGKNGSHKALAKRVLKGKWDTPAEKDLVLAYQLYAEYAGRAGIYTSAMWWLATEMFSDKEPTMEEFADFWTGANSHKVDLGNNEGMVVNKQVGEFQHWFEHPRHSLVNKMSLIPKAGLEFILDKQYVGMKHGTPTGPALEGHLGKAFLSKLTPIVGQPFLQDDLTIEQKIAHFFSGGLGLPINYIAPDK